MDTAFSWGIFEEDMIIMNLQPFLFYNNEYFNTKCVNVPRTRGILRHHLGYFEAPL